MLLSPRNRWLPALCFTLLMAAAGSCSSPVDGAPPGPPATAAEAAKALNLATLPLMKGAEEPRRRTVAGLAYNVRGDIKSVFEFHRSQLTRQKWKELPGVYLTEQGANASLARDGFVVSIMVFPAGEAGVVSVTLMNHGNVELSKLPVPSGAEPSFAAPASAMFITGQSVEKTAEECRKLLTAKGWQPYGKAGDALFFKQNGVRLTASVVSAPAQGGKTMITYSSELMSVDLPAPADTIGLQYADVTSELMFDTEAPMNETFDFYRQALAKAGWRATLDEPIKLDAKDTLLFRNPQQDMLTLESYEVDGKQRVILKHQTAAELARIEAQIKAEAKQRKTKERTN